MTQCELCGTMHDKTGSIPECPDCFEVACSNPRLYKWMERAVHFAVARAVYAAGEDLYAHTRNKKHETNMHYVGRMS